MNIEKCLGILDEQKGQMEIDFRNSFFYKSEIVDLTRDLIVKVLYQMLSILSEFLESFQFTQFLFMMLLPHNSDSFSYYFLSISQQLYFWFAASVFIDLRQSHASLWSSRIGKRYKVISSDIYRQQGFNHKYFDKSFSILFNCAIIYSDLFSL